MTNKKISALSSASTPLTGSEIVPINQSSVTDSVSVANLTAGRSVSASDYVMSTGNLVPGTAAKGINFTANTPSSGMLSQLLNWYEEGTWTPTDGSGASLSLTVTYARYIRVGKQVTVFAYITYPTTVNGFNAQISGIPFTTAGSMIPPCVIGSNAAVGLYGLAAASSTSIYIYNNSTNAPVSNASLSGKYVLISLIYSV